MPLAAPPSPTGCPPAVLGRARTERGVCSSTCALQASGRLASGDLLDSTILEEASSSEAALLSPARDASGKSAKEPTAVSFKEVGRASSMAGGRRTWPSCRGAYDGRRSRQSSRAPPEPRLRPWEAVAAPRRPASCALQVVLLDQGAARRAPSPSHTTGGAAPSRRAAPPPTTSATTSRRRDLRSRGNSTPRGPGLGRRPHVRRGGGRMERGRERPWSDSHRPLLRLSLRDAVSVASGAASVSTRSRRPSAAAASLDGASERRAAGAAE